MKKNYSAALLLIIPLIYFGINIGYSSLTCLFEQKLNKHETDYLNRRLRRIAQTKYMRAFNRRMKTIEDTREYTSQLEKSEKMLDKTTITSVELKPQPSFFDYVKMKVKVTYSNPLFGTGEAYFLLTKTFLPSGSINRGSKTSVLLQQIGKETFEKNK